MKKLSDKTIVDSWKKNVRPWIDAIDKGEIASRVQVTNQAVCSAIIARSPGKALDVGCGEGWLVRELVSHGIDAMGVDAVPEFIGCAIARGDGRFAVLAYEDLNYGALTEKFDVIVCNFSLLGEQVVVRLLRELPALLQADGVVIVQTIHPRAKAVDGPYEDGWRAGSWAGFSPQFSDPAPWYFRTLETWQALFKDAGFARVNIEEPINQITQEVASIVFIAEVAR